MDKILYNIPYLEDFDYKGEVLIPSEKNPSKIYLVLIYAGFCHYCTEFIPIYQKLATELGGSGVEVVCIQADGETEDEKALGERLDSLIPRFSGYPTIVSYKGGNLMKTFDDKRTPENIIKFVRDSK